MPSKPLSPAPKFFAKAADWRAWLEKHHAAAEELWVGFYKRDSGRASITWPESVDGAICFGWIDGVRKSIDSITYKIRFTPRKPGSIWSAINIRRAKELSELGLMHSAGTKAFEKRDSDRSAIYAYEQRKTAKLPAQYERQFKRNKEAWAYFQAQPAWYRRTSTYWVISAKREETRFNRLVLLMKCSEKRRAIPPLTRPTGTK